MPEFLLLVGPELFVVGEAKETSLGGMIEVGFAECDADELRWPNNPPRMP